MHCAARGVARFSLQNPPKIAVAFRGAPCKNLVPGVKYTFIFILEGLIMDNEVSKVHIQIHHFQVNNFILKVLYSV